MRARISIAAVLGSIFLLAPATAEAFIYWFSYNGTQSKVGRAGLDGSAVNYDLATGINGGGGVATNGQYVYWGQAGGGIARANADGTGVNAAFQSAAPTCGSGTFGLEDTPAHLYWLKASGGSCNAFTVERGSIGGLGGYTSLGSAANICGFDVSATHVYWSEGQYIARAAIEPPGAPEHTWLNVGTGYQACGIAVNSTHIYWTNHVPAPLPAQRGLSIGRASISGDPESVEKEFLTSVSIISGATSDIDVEGGFIYWTNLPADTPIGDIARANLDGTGVDLSFIDDIFRPANIDVDAEGPPPAPPGTTPKPGSGTGPAPFPPLIVGVSTSNSSFAPSGGSTPVRLSAGLASPSAKKRPPRGTVFRYRLDQDAAVTVEVRKVKAGRLVKGKCKKRKKANAKKPKCDLAQHKLLRSAAAGANNLSYTARVKGRALKPGKYRAVFTATGPGGKSNSASVGFRIVKP